MVLFFGGRGRGVYRLIVGLIGVDVPCHSTPSLLLKGGVNP